MSITIIDEGNLSHLQGKLLGPPGTPYEGGAFLLDIVIPDSYPFAPPKVKFITRIWHPNISSQTGAICLDILKDQWAAAMSLRTVLLSIQALLAAAEPDDPQDAVVASQYKSRHADYVAQAREWTSIHATGRDPTATPENLDKIRQLVALGFPEAKARVALVQHGWNVEQAASSLLA